MKPLFHNLSAGVLCIFSVSVGAIPVGAANPLTQENRYEGSHSTVAQERKWFNHVDDYKLDAARRIAQVNRSLTFYGELPRLIPAVVVLRITVDEVGRIVDVWVQRAPENGAAEAAIAIRSIHRTAVLPPPLNLLNERDQTMSYSETFLFNNANKFQIRTLAPVQTSD